MKKYCSVANVLYWQELEDEYAGITEENPSVANRIKVLPGFDDFVDDIKNDLIEVRFLEATIRDDTKYPEIYNLLSDAGWNLILRGDTV